MTMPAPPTATPSSPGAGMRWSLDDMSLAVRDFRGPHEQNEDTGLTWETLTGEIEEIRQFAR